MLKAQKHFFRDASDARTAVRTSWLARGGYRATIFESTEPLPPLAGYGDTRMEAIADLQKRIDQEVGQ